MITIYWIYKNKINDNWENWEEVETSFADRKKALKFLYKISSKYGYTCILGWVCDDINDLEWLERRFHY